jgi:hypothetical protein
MTDLSISPMSLFKDITYLGHGPEAEAWKAKIERHCLEQLYFAFIDYHKDYGWVFHTMLTPPDTKSVKQISSLFQGRKDPPAKYKAVPESGLEQEVFDYLKSIGQHPRRQVRLPSGRADIVTEAAVYELKDRLTREKLFSAIGQVLIYRQEIDADLAAVVVGRPSNQYTENIVAMAAEMNIEVWKWKS